MICSFETKKNKKKIEKHQALPVRLKVVGLTPYISITCVAQQLAHPAPSPLFFLEQLVVLCRAQAKHSDANPMSLLPLSSTLTRKAIHIKFVFHDKKGSNGRTPSHIRESNSSSKIVCGISRFH